MYVAVIHIGEGAPPTPEYRYKRYNVTVSARRRILYLIIYGIVVGILHIMRGAGSFNRDKKYTGKIQIGRIYELFAYRRIYMRKLLRRAR